MKKCLVLIAMVSLQLLIAQEKGTLDLLTSGKWYVEYFIVEDEKLEFAPEVQNNNWMLFYPKGKAEYMLQGKRGVGRWEYNEASQILKTIQGKEIKKHKIITITEKKLLLEELGEENAIIGMKKKLNN